MLDVALDRELAQLRSDALTQLSISERALAEEGAASLAEALKCNTSLTQLNLCKNQVGDAGVARLAEALGRNTSLTSPVAGRPSFVAARDRQAVDFHDLYGGQSRQ